MTHVVVVEDDAMNALLFRKLLEKRCDCRVTVTESPDQLLALVRSGDVGLVLMDVSLSNSRHQGRSVNGVDLCRVLKTSPDTAAVPVVLARISFSSTGSPVVADASRPGARPRTRASEVARVTSRRLVDGREANIGTTPGRRREWMAAAPARRGSP